jgi:sirohydrochlorin cobaltochelatase
VKRGILLVAFGAGNALAAATLRRVQARAEQRFSLPARWAYTSETMRERLALARTKSDSVLKALRRMRFERYSQVAVQSLHIIPGREYSGVADNASRAGEEGDLRVGTGKPLLTAQEDAPRLAGALLRHLPPQRRPDESVVCMAHGGSRAAESLYPAWRQAVWTLDPHVHVACMLGALRLDALLPRLRQARSRRIWLLPLLSVVGKHSMQDMAGNGAESWKSRLEEEGFTVIPDLRGLAEGPDFVELWLDRLAQALREFDAPERTSAAPFPR